MRKKRVSCFSYWSRYEFLAKNSSGDNTSFLNTSILMLLIRIRFEYNFKLVSNRTQLRSTSWTEEWVTTSLCWSHLSTSSSVKLGSRFVKKSKPQRRSSWGKFFIRTHAGHFLYLVLVGFSRVGDARYCFDRHARRLLSTSSWTKAIGRCTIREGFYTR